MISGRKMICLVISQCLSVSCKLMSVVSCRHGSPGNLEKEVYHFPRLLWLTVSLFCSLRCWWNASILRVVRW